MLASTLSSVSLTYLIAATKHGFGWHAADISAEGHIVYAQVCYNDILGFIHGPENTARAVGL